MNSRIIKYINWYLLSIRPKCLLDVESHKNLAKITNEPCSASPCPLHTRLSHEKSCSLSNLGTVCCQGLPWDTDLGWSDLAREIPVCGDELPTCSVHPGTFRIQIALNWCRKNVQPDIERPTLYISFWIGACGWLAIIATGRHRNTSFTKALIYGKFDSSSIIRLLFEPTTPSSSYHAFGRTFGNAQEARTKLTKVELEVSFPAPKSIPVKAAISSGFKS